MGEAGALPPEEIYRRMRGLALDAGPLLASNVTSHDAGVLGVIVDIPDDGNTATLVAMIDNTTSLYTSTGGGTIGAGAHERVAVATQALLAAAEAQLEDFAPTDDAALPPGDTARIFLLTPEGRRRADVPLAGFWESADMVLAPVVAGVQSVITAVRTATGR